MSKILVADDEPFYLKTTGELLRNAGYECECVTDAEAAIVALERESFDLILSDLNMPGNFKLELLRESRRRHAQIPLIVITGVPSLPTAIESVRLGITDYLLKPVKVDDLLASVGRALAEAPQAPGPVSGDSAKRSAKFAELIGDSPPMQDLLEIIERVAETNTNVLLTGESGTGKEVVARAIHRTSLRNQHPFQVIDCTAIPESLFESVLFGHAKGSFTGAVQDQVGLLSQCHRGTAFLDELGELPAGSQAKLLRAIQEQTFTPVGQRTPIQVDTRFIGATNRDLQAEVDAGRFRGDLFYRLAVIHIELPPLRERGEDVSLLAKRFLEELMPVNRSLDGFTDAALDCLRQYAWPGNIRELRNVVERAVALARGQQIDVDDLPKQLREQASHSGQTPPPLAEISREEAIDSAEHSYLTAVMQKHEGNIAAAARQAGLSRQGMNKLLKRHAINADDYRHQR
ncbi:sigma-54-dependent transcriptional regulator [Roseimaritima ulvae]|uniref:Transcriptional regulatory protein ZraR n=1 Tax=Roseimaritima ulvae TaxID=980254 RepID=A0A5B9QSD3_9BACT|nr:sigma-54 dependent transcriptional regulator [Roseimaritima ulvae]QEG41968.1 Transcriptional regulatory protein ZraR [Roseimaritima ulvae]